jgi:hypothetical protein
MELEANDRTDALFAEHVMGWMAVGTRRRGVTGALYDTDVWQGVPTRSDILRDVPRYSRSLEDAWKGLERYPWPKYMTCLQRTDTGNWRCDVELNSGHGPTISAAAATPALAIVRCLLQVAERERQP